MNKTPYFHKPIHTTSARKREIERVMRLIRAVKSMKELKRETVREFFFFFLLPGPYEWLSLRFHILKSQKKKNLIFLWNILEYVIEYFIPYFCFQRKPPTDWVQHL